jgi:hypothetical protein
MMRQFDADCWLTAYTAEMGARPLKSVREKGLALPHELVGLCRFTVLVLLTSHFHHSQCQSVKDPPSCAMRTPCAGHRQTQTACELATVSVTRQRRYQPPKDQPKRRQARTSFD